MGAAQQEIRVEKGQQDRESRRVQLKRGKERFPKALSYRHMEVGGLADFLKRGEAGGFP